MPSLLCQRIACPYCGESFETLVDSSETNDDYIEDCQVCCQPITFKLREDASGKLSVTTLAENE